MSFLSCWSVDNFKVLPLASGEYGLDYYCGEELVNGPHANCKPYSDFKQCLKAKEYLAEDNYNLMEEHNLFEELEVDGD
jgi:hypothetical protein